MGMFCMPNGDKSGDLVEAAIGNLQIFMEEWKHDRGEIHCSQQNPNEYLLTMAISMLEEAKGLYAKECEANPNVNPPRPPDPLIDIDLALEHAKGDEVENCSMLLCFFRQHPDQINELLGRIDPSIQSKLGVTAVLRYTWQSQDIYPNWKKLINTAWKFYENDNREELFHGLTKFVDK
jgi:hypothetical protein